jgi:proteasome accessory factor C
MSELTIRRVRDILHLISYVHRHPGAHVSDVAKSLGVPPSKVRALIEHATMCGKAPFDPADLIEIAIDAKGRLHLEFDQRLGEPLRLSRQEAIAFVVALRTLREDGELGGAADSALDKLKAAISKPAASVVEEVESRIALESETGGITKHLRALRRGLDEGRAVDIVYYSSSRDAVTQRRLRTFALLQHLGQWYAVGRDSLRKEIRIFKVERIKEAELSAERYEIPSSFKPERYRRKGKLLVGRRYREARVRFRNAAARIVREEWPKRLVEEGREGDVVGILHYTSEQGLANWLLAYGGDAEVLEPPEMRHAMAARAEAALAHYRSHS